MKFPPKGTYNCFGERLDRRRAVPALFSPCNIEARELALGAVRGTMSRDGESTEAAPDPRNAGRSGHRCDNQRVDVGILVLEIVGDQIRFDYHLAPPDDPVLGLHLENLDRFQHHLSQADVLL